MKTMYFPLCIVDKISATECPVFRGFTVYNNKIPGDIFNLLH